MTPNLTSIDNIRSILKKHNLNLKKSLGQNFLTDSKTVEDIASAAELSGDETVIEIGPGIGTLTKELAKGAKNVIAVELDSRLIPILEENLETFDNIEIINGDILKLDLNELLKEKLENGERIKVAANLPYYITTPVLMKFLESGLPIERMSFLVQKEVAERIASESGNKVYGALSVISQYYANPSILFEVSADKFLPRPKVDSALIVLEPKEGALEEDERKAYFKLVKAAFANRRKTLLNSLSANLNLGKDVIREKLEEIGIDPGVRAEKLSKDQFREIAAVLDTAL